MPPSNEIRITGLKPSTRYRYAVGDGTQRLGGGTEDFFFVTEMETLETQAGVMVTQQLRGYDPDGDSLEWSVENMPPGGTLTGTCFFWVSSLQDAGVWDIVFVADDGRGGVARSTWTVRLADEDGVVPEPDPVVAPFPAESDSGCGCAGAGSAGMLALALAFAAGRRRSLTTRG